MSTVSGVQWTLVIVNAWIVNNLPLVNIFGETGRLFYNINYMLNNKHLSIVNKIGDKTEFTITRVHCTCLLDILELQLSLNLTKQSLLLMIEGGGGTNTPDNIQVYTIIQRVGVY